MIDRKQLGIVALVLAVIAANVSRAADKGPVKGPDNTRTTLPHELPEHKVLRDFISTLTEKDFVHGVNDGLTLKPEDFDGDYRYRQHLFTLMPQPLVGTKRGIPAINAPARLFVLSAIERSEGVHVPPVWPETLIAFTQWKYPGNAYYGNRALKLRAFVTATVMMTMLDDQIDNYPELGGSRADWLSYQLVVYGSPYPGFQDVLPAPVQKAYETVLRKFGRRVLDWGPKGEEPNMDMISAVGLYYVGKVLKDEAFSKEVEAYAKRLYTDPRYYHPAGFGIDNGGIDIGYQGTTNYFANWAALAGGWAFAKDAVDRTYRLRAHLLLPEPDGMLVGPCHFNSRTSSDAATDQWGWNGVRDGAAAMLTDEAVYVAKLPSEAELKDAPERRSSAFAGQIHENPVSPKGGFITNEEINSHPWKWRLWHSFNFPVSMNPAHDFYVPGTFAHRKKLEQENSPWLKSPFLRDETFLRDFEKAFTVARSASYAAIVYTGPVGQPNPEGGTFKFAGPLGFGGGQLSAFWTPKTGSVLVARRGGNTWDKALDLIDQWRTWPLHAVSGCKLDGKVFTSGRIRQPDVVSDVSKATNSGEVRGTVQASGVIPVEQLAQGKVLEGKINFARTFKFEPGKLSVETKLQAFGQDKLSELYETLPVYLQDASQSKSAPTKIEFQVAGKWIDPTAELISDVAAVRLTRFDGAVLISFDKPQKCKLSPDVWADNYLSRARCRNVMIDLLEGVSPKVFRGEHTVGYTITAVQ